MVSTLTPCVRYIRTVYIVASRIKIFPTENLNLSNTTKTPQTSVLKKMAKSPNCMLRK